MNKCLQDIIDWIINYMQTIFKEHPSLLDEDCPGKCYKYLHNVNEILSSVENDTKTIFQNTSFHFQIELIARTLAYEFPISPSDVDDDMSCSCGDSEPIYIDKQYICNNIRHKLMLYFSNIKNSDETPTDPITDTNESDSQISWNETQRSINEVIPNHLKNIEILLANKETTNEPIEGEGSADPTTPESTDSTEENPVVPPVIDEVKE